MPPAATRSEREQLLEREPGVGDDPDHRLEVAPDLVRIDVDVDEPGGRDAVGEAGQPGAGRAVVEAGPEGEDDVGIAACGIGHVRAVASGHPQAQAMAGIEHTLAEGRRRHRDGQGLRVRQQRGLGPAQLDPVPGDDDRTLRFRQEASGFRDGSGIARRSRPSRFRPVVFPLG